MKPEVSNLDIVFLNLEPSGSGAHTAVKRISSLIEEVGYKVRFFTNEDLGKWSRLYRKICRFLVHSVSSFKTLDGSFNIFPTKIHKVINSSNESLIFIHWIGSEFVSLSDLSRMKGQKIVVLHDEWWLNPVRHIEGDFDSGLSAQRISSFLFTLLLRRKITFLSQCRFIVIPSHWLSTKFKTKSFVPDKIVRQIPNPGPTRVIPVTPILQTNKSSEKCFKILFVANYIHDPNKGLTFLLSALRVLERLEIDWELYVVGSFQESELDISSERISIVGSIDQYSLSKLYRQVDVLVVPSLRENQPSVVLEGLAYGLPIVAFRIEAIQELITHKINGYIVDQFSAEGIAEGILWSLRCFHRDEHNALQINDARNSKVQNMYRELIEESIKHS